MWEGRIDGLEQLLRFRMSKAVPSHDGGEIIGIQLVGCRLGKVVKVSFRSSGGLCPPEKKRGTGRKEFLILVYSWVRS